MTLTKLINILMFLRLRKTKKIRSQLRHQKVVYIGRVEYAYNWLKEVNANMPPMIMHGGIMNHYEKLKKMYYRYDIRGVNYYIRLVSKATKRDLKIIAKELQ